MSWSLREPSTPRRASCSRLGPSPSCSSSGGCRSRWACSCVPARWMCRTGGTYRLVFGDDGSNPAEFFGRYIEVTPHSRLVWTNDEAGDGGPVTTVTFEEKGWQDAAGPARALSLEGSSRRCRDRGGGGDARAVRAAGRASRHAGRPRGTIVKLSLSSAWLRGFCTPIRGAMARQAGATAPGSRIGPVLPGRPRKRRARNVPRGTA